MNTSQKRSQPDGAGRSEETTLVLGLGNLLLGDEGVGVHAAHLLDSEGLPNTMVLDVGTAIIDALPALERADRVIVLDAMTAQGDPGTIYRVPIDRCRRAPTIASMHGFDIQRVLILCGRQDLPDVVALGVEPAVIGWSMELSPPVAASLPAFLQAVRDEVVRPVSPAN